MTDRLQPDLLEASDFPVRFGRYTLLGVLGEGGMARVFRAELEGPSGFRKPAALKIIRASVTARDQARRAALVAEARLGGLLHHPNIVETYDFGEEGSTPWIAMELVDGLGLDTALLHGPLPPGIAVEVVAQICRGLHHAHEALDRGVPAGLVHRDLKPSNVIITRGGLAKVMDFGIAKAATIVGEATEEGLTKGTPAYMSPEQASAHHLDRRSDLFSVGLLLHELLLGRSFFEGRTVMSLLMEIVRVEDRLALPDALAGVDALVPGLGAVVRTCLRADRELRWRDAAALERALRSVQQGTPPEASLADWVESCLLHTPSPSVAYPTPGGTTASPRPPAMLSPSPSPSPPAPPGGPEPEPEEPEGAGGSTWSVALWVVAALILAAAAFRLTASEPPPKDREPEEEFVELPDVALGPGEVRLATPTPAPAEPTPAPTHAGPPPPAPTPRPAPAAAAPTPAEEPPAPPPVSLAHAPAEEALVGSANTVGVRLDGASPGCTPWLHWGPWAADRPSDYASRRMGTTGGGRFAVDVFLPYAEAYAAGFQYYIACRAPDGRVLARTPSDGGVHRVPALAR